MKEEIIYEPLTREKEESLYRAFLKSLGEARVFRNEPLREHVSFRVGGPCRIMVCPKEEEELLFVLALCRDAQIPYFILGRGTNLIPLDEGYDGVVIKLGAFFEKICVIPELSVIRAQGGALLSALSRTALSYGLSGLEFAGGIPGTLGGAVMMNAGAYDGEIGGVIEKVRFLDGQGHIREWDRNACDFGYRHSAFQDREGRSVILSAQMVLQKGDPERIREKMEDFAKRRAEKQPLSFPSAGSTFKRPPGQFAGKLIQDAGLMGLSVGGAMVSDLHAGFIINTGTATAKDILELITLVQNTVRDTFGVMLEPEVKVLR